jgi:C_GCAxxG_C_C family probable redox protein
MAYAPKLGLDAAAARGVAGGFGGGIGGTHEYTCGAFSAAVIIYGVLNGGYDPADLAAKKNFYSGIKALRERFVAENGSINCRELLLSASEKKKEAERGGVISPYKRPCVKYVADIADAIDALYIANSY